MELYAYFEELISAPAVIDEFSSLRWRRKFYEPGEFELHIENTRRNREICHAGTEIVRIGCVEHAIVETVQMQGYDLIITGRMSEKDMEGEVIRSFTFYGRADQAMAQAFLAAVPSGIVGPLPGVTDTVSLQLRWRTLADIEQRLARAYGLGYRYGPTGFEVYSGQARPGIVFSDDYDNLYAPDYTYSEKGYFVRAFVAGEGEGDARKYVVVGADHGPAIYVDARDLQQGTLSDADYNKQLQQRGIEKLAACAPVGSFECTVIPDGYREKWDLGDTVKLQYTPWGILMDKRITEVEEIYEQGKTKIIPTFGDPLPEKLSLGSDN